MSYLLLLHPEFEVELTKAAIWYEKRLQGLGVDFVVSAKQGIQLVEREPELFPVVYKSIRRILLKKFP